MRAVRQMAEPPGTVSDGLDEPNHDGEGRASVFPPAGIRRSGAEGPDASEFDDFWPLVSLAHIVSQPFNRMILADGHGADAGQMRIRQFRFGRPCIELGLNFCEVPL